MSLEQRIEKLELQMQHRTEDMAAMMEIIQTQDAQLNFTLGLQRMLVLSLSPQADAEFATLIAKQIEQYQRILNDYPMNSLLREYVQIRINALQQHLSV